MQSVRKLRRQESLEKMDGKQVDESDKTGGEEKGNKENGKQWKLMVVIMIMMMKMMMIVKV